MTLCVAKWKLQTRRAWHGWCVANALIAIPRMFRVCVCADCVHAVVRRVRVLASCELPRCAVVRLMLFVCWAGLRSVVSVTCAPLETSLSGIIVAMYVNGVGEL